MDIKKEYQRWLENATADADVATELKTLEDMMQQKGRDITLRKQSLTTTSGTSGLFWKARIGFL